MTTFYMIEANWQYIILCIVSPSKEEQTVNKQHDCGWVTEGTGGLSPLPSTGGRSPAHHRASAWLIYHFETRHRY